MYFVPNISFKFKIDMLYLAIQTGMFTFEINSLFYFNYEFRRSRIQNCTYNTIVSSLLFNLYTNFFNVTYLLANEYLISYTDDGSSTAKTCLY